VPPDGRDLVARGQVVHGGRSYAVANAEVTNADGKRVALATGSSAYRQPQ
jgi:acyl-coenzyme A thioesterase PaaI-like protein